MEENGRGLFKGTTSVLSDGNEENSQNSLYLSRDLNPGPLE